MGVACQHDSSLLHRQVCSVEQLSTNMTFDDGPYRQQSLLDAASSTSVCLTASHAADLGKHVLPRRAVDLRWFLTLPDRMTGKDSLFYLWGLPETVSTGVAFVFFPRTSTNNM